MEKYIRTKDGVYSTSELIKCEDKRFPEGWFTKTGVPLIAIKQADTIEELIDGWVVRRYVMDEPCHWFYNSKEQMKANISLRNPCYSIYGAIWTDKGLIYVAKMNDKGELELL